MKRVTISRFPLIYVSEKTDGYNGNNNLFRIDMLAGVDNWISVLAQEIREQRIVWVIVGTCLAVGLGLNIYTSFDVSTVIAAVGLLFFSILARTLPPVRRFIEIRGHATEIASDVVFFSVPPIASIEREAKALSHSGYKGAFNGWSMDKRRAALADAIPGAEKWIRKRRVWLTKLNAARSKAFPLTR